MTIEASTDADTPSAFIRSLPKAELHLHLEGTVDPATLAELSRRHPTPLSTTNNRYTNIADSGRVFTEDEARALYQYKDFTGFLLAFKAVTERLRTAEDYELVTYRMMQKLHAQNVLHAEVYVSVGVIHWRGGEFAPLFEGLERGRSAASATSECRCTGSSTLFGTSESRPRSGARRNHRAAQKQRHHRWHRPGWRRAPCRSGAVSRCLRARRE